MFQDWKSSIKNNNYDLDSLMDDYNNFRDTQQTMGMLNNMGVFGQNTGMSNFADNFSTWGSNGEGGGFFGGGEGGTGAGGALGWIGIAQNGMNGLQKGLDAAYNNDEDTSLGGVGNGIQGFFGNDQYDNNIAQAIAGSGNGAKMGFGVGGPWGAVAGGILGAGSAFLDDIE